AETVRRVTYQPGDTPGSAGSSDHSHASSSTSESKMWPPVSQTASLISIVSPGDTFPRSVSQPLPPPPVACVASHVGWSWRWKPVPASSAVLVQPSYSDSSAPAQPTTPPWHCVTSPSATLTRLTPIGHCVFPSSKIATFLSTGFP